MDDEILIIAWECFVEWGVTIMRFVIPVVFLDSVELSV